MRLATASAGDARRRRSGRASALGGRGARRGRELLARAAGQTKRGIEELLAKLEKIFGAALDLLVERVKKERFGVGCKPRRAPAGAGKSTTATTALAAAIAAVTASRYVPRGVRRAVYLRDGGRCTFVDERGHRCCATSGLEVDHIDGWARTRSHDADRLRLLCRSHHRHAANEMYGRAFMERARANRTRRTRPGASSSPAEPRDPPPRAAADFAPGGARQEGVQ